MFTYLFFSIRSYIASTYSVTPRMARLLRKYPWPPSTEIGFTPSYGIEFSSGLLHLPKCHTLDSEHFHPLGFSSVSRILFSLPIQSTPLSMALRLRNAMNFVGIMNTSLSTLKK